MNLHKLYIPALVVLGALLLFGASVWIGEREARIRAEEQDKAFKAIIADKDKNLADRDRQWQQQQADFQKQIDGIKTVAQARQVLQPIILPASNSPQPEQIKKSDLPTPMQKDLPGAPDAKFSLLSDDQVIALAKREKQCQETEAGLTHCKADVVDWRGKFDASQEDVKTWKTAAKGGSWIRRTLRVAVPVGCAGGGAWLGSKAAGGAKGATIGALTAGGACALSFRF